MAPRPRRRSAAQREYEFSPSDVDFHATPPVGSCVHAIEGRYHALAKERTMLLRCESFEPPMSQSGLGCAKTLAVAPHVEISPGNCIPESQIILHTRGSMPCWRMLFSNFGGCRSFTKGPSNLVLGPRPAPRSG